MTDGMPGLPPGYLRLDEVFQKVVQKIRANSNLAATVQNLVGLDVYALQAEIKAEPTAIILNPVAVGYLDGPPPQIVSSGAASPEIRARDAQECVDEAVSVAAVKVLMEQVIAGRLTVLWLNNSMTMQLRPDEFPLRSAGSHIEAYTLWGRALVNVPGDIPISSWMSGNAELYDTARSITGRTLFVSEAQYRQADRFISVAIRAPLAQRAAGAPQAHPKRKKPWTPEHTQMLTGHAERHLQDRGAKLSQKDAVQWARDNGLNINGVKEHYKDIPGNHRNRRGAG